MVGFLNHHYARRMTRPRRSALFAGAVLVVLALSACGPTPTPTAGPSETAGTSPTPAPTLDAELVPEFIAVSGTGIAVGDVNYSRLIEIPFTTDGNEAAELLAETIGVEPTVTAIAGDGGCQAPTTVYDWGGLVLDVPGVITTAPDAQFSATITAATTSTGLSLFLDGPGLLPIGTSQAILLNANPGADVYDNDFGGFIALSIASPPGTPEQDVWGVYGGLSDGALSLIVSPVYIFGDC
jgi:hypothetical protein